MTYPNSKPKQEGHKFTYKCHKCGTYTRKISNTYLTCGKCYMEWKKEQRRQENERKND